MSVQRTKGDDENKFYVERENLCPLSRKVVECKILISDWADFGTLRFKSVKTI